MPPITRAKSRATRRKLAGLIDEPDLDISTAESVAKSRCIEKVERAPLWSAYENTILADVVGFTDASGRTSCATTKHEHFHLRVLG